MKVWICQPLDAPHLVTVHATQEGADAAYEALGGTNDAYVYARDVQGLAPEAEPVPAGSPEPLMLWDTL